MREFNERILHHLRELDSEGKLQDDGFGHALLELSKVKGITDEDLVNEIGLMFIAGLVTRDSLLHTAMWPQ